MTDFETLLLEDLKYGFIDRTSEAQRSYNPLLISNDESATMLQAIRDELRRSDSFTFSVAFISSAALAMLKQDLLDFRGRGTIITSNYLDFNTPKVLRELLELKNIEVRILPSDSRGFHAKGYLFKNAFELTAIVGSSNLTDNALLKNQEWNIRFSSSQNGDITYQVDSAIEMQRERSFLLTREWIENYEKNRRPRIIAAADFGLPSDQRAIQPNKMQNEALESLASLRERGESKALIISATGTGKTILAALAMRDAKPKRILFVAHREQILRKAQSEFQRVNGGDDADYGFFVGNTKDTAANFIFASVQSLFSNENYRRFAQDYFDFVIIDEVHRGAAASYQPLFDYFNSKFLLGLTATPERTDNNDIFRLFDFNVPYEIRLQGALDAGMLTPFHYYGITDYEIEGGEVVGDTTTLRNLTSDERVEFVLEKIREYGFPEDVRGLMFCSSKQEATELSRMLNERYLFGRQLRTMALFGDHSQAQREAAIRALEDGELDYILTVDIFNEGTDIPSINQVVMLRPTQSSIIFTQQLGRGLRKAPGKDHLRVIDFIGNYKNSFLIPIALFGDSSRSKNSIRQQLVRNRENNTVANLSTVNFDEISRERIFSSLASASIDTVTEFKKDIKDLFNRLNEVPRLSDFARFDTVDPVVISTRRTGSYWELLAKTKYAEKPPTEQQAKYLKFLSNELLPGKQPQELLLLKKLLNEGPTSKAEFTQYLAKHLVAHESEDLSVVERVLDLSFYPATAYKPGGLVRLNNDTYELVEEFQQLYKNASGPYPTNFKIHVDDIIETGLFLSRDRNYFSGNLVVGQRYSRKDVSRILHLQSNQEGTLNGYKVDKYSKTIPIFINYQKHSEINASINYEDEFLSTSVLRWFTRSRRTLKSKEVQAIVSNQYPIHVFVRRDDAEGEAFYYLGEATSSNAVQTHMPGNDGNPLNVVTMHLTLSHPISEGFSAYLHTAALEPTP